MRVVLAEGRTVVARCWASGLIDDSVLAFGADHLYTRDAWELLAHVVRTALAERWPAAAASDPFLFPHGDLVSVYVTDPQQTSRR